MKDTNFRIIPGLHLPLITVSDLEELLATTRLFNIQHIRFTANNQLAVSDIDDTILPELIAHLQQFMTKIDADDLIIMSCKGCGNCTCGVDTAASLVQRIKNLEFQTSMPAKVKVAVAGCPRCCTMPFVRDIGMIPVNGAWTLTFGGNGGGKPRIGDVLAKKIPDNEVVRLVYNSLLIYCEHAEPKQRTSRFIEKFGIEWFKKQLFSI